jgi:energy-coupling factor transport system permease protein
VLDARAWLTWALTVLLAASYNRNPLYSVLLLLVTVWVVAACAIEKDAPPTLAPLRFAGVAVPMTALFNVLATNLGTTVLFHLPTWLPLVGGAVTLEALAFGIINGLNLTVIFSGFTAFNGGLATRELLQLAPRAFHESGVVVSIALNFVPQTLQSLQRIREAQAVRGHRIRGIRDWIPILTPLLVSALERAMTLAESMVARGYAAASRTPHLRIQVLLALGLLTSLGGWLTYLFAPTARTLATATLLLGIALLSGALWLAGRAVQHTTYRPRHWCWRDTLTVVGCLPLLTLLLTRQAAFTYTPYPTLTWPPFAPWIGVSVLGLLAPILFPTHDRESI